MKRKCIALVIAIASVLYSLTASSVISETHVQNLTEERRPIFLDDCRRNETSSGNRDAPVKNKAIVSHVNISKLGAKGCCALVARKSSDPWFVRELNLMIPSFKNEGEVHNLRNEVETNMNKSSLAKSVSEKTNLNLSTLKDTSPVIIIGAAPSMERNTSEADLTSLPLLCLKVNGSDFYKEKENINGIELELNDPIPSFFDKEKIRELNAREMKKTEEIEIQNENFQNGTEKDTEFNSSDRKSDVMSCKKRVKMCKTITQWLLIKFIRATYRGYLILKKSTLFVYTLCLEMAQDFYYKNWNLEGKVCIFLISYLMTSMYLKLLDYLANQVYKALGIS